MIKDIYIVHHTHWDREWYQSYDEFLVKLRDGVTYIIDLLDQEKIECFYFDGQTIIVEDLKEALNEDYYTKFEAYLNKGIIEIGPNYILADESLSNGEQFVSNLRLGREIYSKYNQNPKVMYLPDTFGHVSQIPQLAKMANLDYSLVHRGVVSEKVTNKWIGADKTAINTHVLQPREGYYQTLFHVPIEKLAEEFEKFVKDNEPYITTDRLLILNGCDHTFLPLDIKEKLQLLKTEYPNYNFKQVTLSEYLETVSFADYQTIEGEQRNPNRAFLLPGVLSTRNYLKVQNQELHDLMYSRVKVISALYNNYEKNNKLINKNSKIMVSNMPHDSICGCSIDSVHTEMEYRYQSVKDSLTKIVDYDLDQKAPYLFSDFETKFNNIINVFNAKSYEVDENFEISFDVLNDLIKDKKIALFADGEELEFEIIKKEVVEKLFSKIYIAPSYQFVTQYTIVTKLNILGYDFKNIEIKLIDGEDELTNNRVTKGNIENYYLKASVDKDSVTIFNKETNETFTDMYVLKYISDRGDSYNFSPVICEEYKTAKIIEHTKLSEDKLQLVYEIKEKQMLDDTRENRIGEQIIQHINVYLQLEQDKITTTVDFKNNLSDIKLLFGFNNKGAEVYTDTAFDLIKRTELSEINYHLEENNSEVHYNQQPTLTSIYTKDKYQLSHLGLNEMEILTNQTYLTLMRAISDLSRRDLKARPGGAGPSYSTPDAQMHRELTYSFNLKFNVTHYDNQQHLSLYKPLVKQSTQALTTDFSFTYNEKVSLTSFEQIKDKLYLRFVNLTEQEAQIDLQINKDCQLKEVNFFNEAVGDFDQRIKTKEIKTIEIEVM